MVSGELREVGRKTLMKDKTDKAGYKMRKNKTKIN